MTKSEAKTLAMQLLGELLDLVQRLNQVHPRVLSEMLHSMEEATAYQQGLIDDTSLDILDLALLPEELATVEIIRSRILPLIVEYAQPLSVEQIHTKYSQSANVG